MNTQEILTVIIAACETADSIVGVRDWKTAEDADAMHNLIFWDMLAKRLPDISTEQLESVLKEASREATPGVIISGCGPA
jgi:hypothetical protein